MTTANKAIAAAVLAGLVALLSELRDKAPVSAYDWIVVVLAALVAGLVVYVTPNRTRRA